MDSNFFLYYFFSTLFIFTPFNFLLAKKKATGSCHPNEVPVSSSKSSTPERSGTAKSIFNINLLLTSCAIAPIFDLPMQARLQVWN